VSEKWPTLRRGDTWCAYGRWKTAAEVPRHILPPPKKPPPFSLFSGSGGGMIHALYVKDGTSLVHVVIDPEAIN
jgi:hypothetical protein